MEKKSRSKIKVNEVFRKGLKRSSLIDGEIESYRRRGPDIQETYIIKMDRKTIDSPP